MVEGLYYRLWQYSSGRSGENDQQEPQIAPLIVACSMEQTDPYPEKIVRKQLDQVAIFLIGTFACAVLIVWRVTAKRNKRRA